MCQKNYTRALRMADSRMNVSAYSEKSIVVDGDTKPWSTYLKDMGGKYNPKLSGGPGWIFSSRNQEAVLNFVNDVNSGVHQPPVVPSVRQPPQILPRIQTTHVPVPPISKVQPIVPPMTSLIGRTQQVQIPRTPVPSPVSSPKLFERTNPRVIPQQMIFPNVFTAADNIEYQILIYTAPIPKIGQGVNIHIDDEDVKYIVAELETENPVDSILITGETKDDEEQDNEFTRCVIINGKWQIRCEDRAHTITFTE